jgi:hypothetical protein
MLMRARAAKTEEAIRFAVNSPFTDVLLTDFAADAIIDLFNLGFTEGCDGTASTPPTRFCPNEAMTKIGFAALLAKLFGVTAPSPGP